MECSRFRRVGVGVVRDRRISRDIRVGVGARRGGLVSSSSRGFRRG